MKLFKKFGIYVCLALMIGTGSLNAQTVKKSESSASIENQENQTAAYANKIFDTSYVHKINIEISETDWQDILDHPTDEAFHPCNVTIDGETIENVGIRTKGNSSLAQVANSDSDRYSFKISFGKYTKKQTYYGLDKMALNNIISDATFMKDYICYKTMADFGVASPKVSYSYITVNGKEWGLYLNVEDVDKAFLKRNYGEQYGNLYKPETDDDMVKMPQAPQTQKTPSDLEKGQQTSTKTETSKSQETGEQDHKMPMPEGMKPDMDEKKKEALGADLVYKDDHIESYSNIFDNAKTDIEEEDKKELISALKILNSGSNLDKAVDVEATLRYFVVHNFVDNYDSYTGNMLHNYYLYQDSEGKLSMLPWDYNLAFGAFGGGKAPGGDGQPPMPVTQSEKEQVTTKTEDKAVSEKTKMPDMPPNVAAPMKESATDMVNMPIDTPLSGCEEAERPLWSQLIHQAAYKEQYHQLFDEFITNYVENNKLNEEIDRVANLIEPYVKKDPTGFYNDEEFKKGVETLKSFVTLRGKSVRGQLKGDIPSTTEGQKAKADALIDASSINLSDMGSQGGPDQKAPFKGPENQTDQTDKKK